MLEDFLMKCREELSQTVGIGNVKYVVVHGISVRNNIGTLASLLDFWKANNITLFKNNTIHKLTLVTLFINPIHKPYYNSIVWFCYFERMNNLLML